MGVYIKGMEMPKNCMLCPFCVEEADPANGEMCMVTGKLMPPCNRERLDDCPLVPVPPHGRLIDADVLCKVLQKNSEDEWNNKTAPFSWAYAYDCVKDTVENMPTILEAEEGET